MKQIESDNGCIQINEIIYELENELFYSCEHNDYEAVFKLLNFGISPNFHKNYSTPLIEAVCNNNFKMVQLLINNGAKANLQHPYGSPTALYYAFMLSSDSIVDILYPITDMNLDSNDLETILDQALDFKRFIYVPLLIRRGARPARSWIRFTWRFIGSVLTLLINYSKEICYVRF